MIYDYKGTEYELPDEWSEEQALKMIRADQGEDTISTPAPAPAPAATTHTPQLQTAPQEPEQNPLQKITSFFKTDIPEVVSGASQRIDEAWKNPLRPTTLGTIAERITGKIQKPQTFVEGLKEAPRATFQAAAAAPETAVRKIGTAGETVGNITSIPFELIGRAISRASGGKVDIGNMIASGIDEGTTQSVSDIYNALPEETKANLRGTGGIVELAGSLKAPKLAKKESAKAARMLRNETGAITIGGPEDLIPDIEDVERAAQSAAPQKLTSFKDIRKSVGEPPKTGFRNPLISEEEAIMLAQKDLPGETPFDEVLRRAYSAKVNRLKGGQQALTPFEIAAAEKAVPAINKIDKMRREVGKIKGDLVRSADEYLISTSQFADATPVQKKFLQLLRDSYGGQVNKSGQIVDAAGQVIKDTSDRNIISKMYRSIDKLRPETTLAEIDGTISDLRNIVEHSKVSQFKQMNTIAEGIGKQIRGDLKRLRSDFIENAVDWGGAESFLGPQGSNRLRNAIVNYERYSSLEDRLNRMIGQVTDQTSGVPQKGASAMKAALVSNARGENKAVFQLVKEITGIDLLREAAKAEVAMKAVGDTRATDLLKEAGVMSSALRGDKIGAAAKLGQKGMELFTGQKPQQLLRYYTKKQKAVTPEESMREAVLRRLQYGGQ